MNIGLCGYIGSGKSTVSKYLQNSYRYTPISLGDVVRDHARKQNLPLTREILQPLGYELIQDDGAYLAKCALKGTSITDRLVIEGIRNPPEVTYLQEALRPFVLVAVDADFTTRASRIILRNRAGDPRTCAELEIVDAKDAGVLPGAQNVAGVLHYASYRINGNGSLQDMLTNVDLFMQYVYEY
jgi:dephospho-CoA kinase